MEIHSSCRLFAAGTCLVCSLYTNAQTTVLDQVYTEEQAQRGALFYETICAECHEGAEPDAERIIGFDFIERWREAPLDYLYGFVSVNMPGEEPGSLAQADYLDVVAYLLSANGYPAGSHEVTVEQLDDILLVGPDGPQPLPAYSLVRVVGCLQKESDDDWTFSSAAGIFRVRVGDETDADELAMSAATPAGIATYSLKNAADYNAEELLGQKAQAKGVLLSQGEVPSISVLSLEGVSGNCVD